MPSIKDLTLTYDVLNEQGTFSEGDTLSGSVILQLQKKTKVESIFVKAIGDANVHWTENDGDETDSYNAHRRFFKLKQYLIPENSKETVLPQGSHHYKFSIKIPQGPMPSSFRGCHGKIVYKVEAKISRSWRMNRTVEKELKFASKSFHNIGLLSSRQVGSTDKEMGLFSKGQVHMDVNVDRRAYAPGETVAIVAKVTNSSSKDMAPKFSLKQKVVYHAQGSTKHGESVICKMVGDNIIPNTEKTITCAMKIPADQTLTIHNCDIISVEYQLKVYLDISFASDPEVKFPLLIVPSDLVPQPGGGVGPYPPGAFGGPSNTDFPPPAVSFGPNPVPSGPGTSGYPAAPGPYNTVSPGYPAQQPTFPAKPAMYPAQPPSMGEVYNNPLPQQAPPPAVSFGPNPVPSGPGTSGYPAAPGPYNSVSPGYPAQPTFPANPPLYAGQPAMYPAQPPSMGEVYNNPLPQQASPYATPFSSSSSSPVLHPPPTAPTFHSPPSAPPMIDPSPTAPTYNLPSVMKTNFLSQQEEVPPSYMSLIPPPAKSPTESDGK